MAYYGINKNNYNDDDEQEQEQGKKNYDYSTNSEYKTPPSIVGIVMCFIFCWPVGIFLLIRRLIYESENPRGIFYRQTQSSYTKRTSAKTRPINKAKPENVLKVVGIICAVTGLLTFFSNYGYYGYMTSSELFLSMIMTAGGIGAFIYSLGEKKRMERFTKYQTIIGDKKCVNISEIAEKIPVSRRKALKDLQEMINRDFFAGAYIDAANDMLVYSGYESTVQKKEKEKPEEPTKKNIFVPEEYRKYINQIKDVNNRIKNEALSEQIYRIENITQRIFDYVSDKPERQPMIKTFMQYYLPTTLKILNAYAEFEKQDIDGKYIGSGKKDIENTMEKVVKSFENLLDKLYMSDVIDVSTDIEALQGMLANDGYAESDDGFKLKL